MEIVQRTSLKYIGHLVTINVSVKFFNFLNFASASELAKMAIVEVDSQNVQLQFSASKPSMMQKLLPSSSEEMTLEVLKDAL